MVFVGFNLISSNPINIILFLLVRGSSVPPPPKHFGSFYA